MSKYRETLCKISWNPFRVYIEYFFTPKDLYQGVFHEIIDISQTDYSKEIPVKFAYVGRYEIILELYRFDWDDLVWEDTKRGINVKLKLDFYKDKKNIFSITTSTDYTTITKGGEKPYTNALALTNDIYVPKNLPNNEDLICFVTVTNSDKELHKLYGPIRLSIKRVHSY